MRLQELLNIIFDDVVIYVRHDESFEDLYRGSYRDVPEELLSREIRIIGAKRKGVLDIEVR